MRGIQCCQVPILQLGLPEEDTVSNAAKEGTASKHRKAADVLLPLSVYQAANERRNCVGQLLANRVQVAEEGSAPAKRLQLVVGAVDQLDEVTVFKTNWISRQTCCHQRLSYL